MHCYVYKGERKPDHYLYLPKELDERLQATLPAAILDLLGDLSLVVDFELSESRNLAQADSAQVLRDIQEQGFYLQMPKKDMLAEEEAYFN